MADLKQYYWDSCVWIGLINREEARIQAIETIYEEARVGKCELWTSTIAFMEVFRFEDETHQSKPLDNENHIKISEIFEQEFVKLVPLDMEVAKNARKFRREIPKLSKGPDAVHLASALKWNIPTLHTYDGSDLLHLSGKLKSKAGNSMTICPPNADADVVGELFVEKVAHAKKEDT